MKYECPVCHRELMSADEACSGSLTEPRHPTNARAVEANWTSAGESCEGSPQRPDIDQADAAGLT